MIDLRSDTVTRPTSAMREAMAAAEVGDDVYAEDPTVNELQRRAAAMLGKEAALFVPSGTMGNQIAIACHTRPGQEVICESRSHVLDYEMGAMAALSGVIPRAVPGREAGRLAWEDIRAAIRPNSTYNSTTGLIAIENTHNMAGGTVMSIEAIQETGEGARSRGLPVHLDGARVFNAAVALRRPVSEIVGPVDSVMFCLSKGLAAPVGSILAGSADFIRRAWLVRKMFGGGMRQAGVLAAAGLVALDRMVERLAEDHENARLLAEGIAGLPGIEIEPETVQTNIVIFDLASQAPSGAEISASLKERGILANPIGPRRMRMVTHNDVSREQCLQAVAAVGEVMAGARSV